MYKQLILLFVLYLAGVTFSPILASEVLPSKKSHIFSLGDDTLEEEGEFHKLLEKLPDYMGPSHAGMVVLHSRTSVFSQVKNLQATQDSRTVPCPLYLLFHSFLFYHLS